jgi:cytochrome P450
MPTEQTQLMFPPPTLEGFEPPAEFDRLRGEQPCALVTLPTGDPAWLVTRYADVRTVLSDRRFSRAAAEAAGAPRVGNTSPGPHTILGMDPPRHTRLRRLVAAAFTPAQVERLRPGAQAIAEGLMRAISVAPRPVDLMGCYALQLPIKVIFEMIGVPLVECDRLHALSEVIFSLGAYPRETVVAARADIETYLAGLIEERRGTPGGSDLLAELVAVRDRESQLSGEDDRLSEEELRNFVLILLTVGHMSTANTLGSAMFVLLRNPDVMARLRDEPALIPTAVEELLRYNPFTLTGTQLRVATEDVELADVTIRRGDGVLACVGAANHDPAVFDDPARFVMDRAENPHVAFGYGVHHCLGAQLARMELQVAIGTLLSRLPALPRLAVPEEWLTLRTGLTGRSLATLPILW